MRRWTWLHFGGVALLCLLALTSWAQNEKRVTIELKDAPITEAFDQLFRAVGENFMLLPTVPTERRLTMRLTDVPFEKVLNFLCDLAGLKWERKEGVYVIGPKQPMVGVGAIGGAFIPPAVLPQVAQPIMPPMTIPIPKAFGFVGGTPTPDLSRVYIAMAIPCPGCGTPVRRECPKCKNLMAWEWKFCPFDGTKLPPPPQKCPKCGRPLPKPIHLHPPAAPEQRPKPPIEE
jgi:hypothetical protein